MLSPIGLTTKISTTYNKEDAQLSSSTITIYPSCMRDSNFIRRESKSDILFVVENFEIVNVDEAGISQQPTEVDMPQPV